MAYAVCKECKIHHYVNCGTCYGFGVYRGDEGVVPISAHEAYTKKFWDRETLACPECGSTHEGIPDGLRKDMS